MIDLLNSSYTQESSVLTGGEMSLSFTLYENTNMANTRIMYCYLRRAKRVHSASYFGTRGPGSIPGWALLTNCFFFFSFSSCNAKLLHTRNIELYK